MVGCGGEPPPPAAKPPRPVRAATVHYEATITTARYSGEVKARYEIPQSFQVAGKLAKRLVSTGALVSRGDLLATLDPADYELSRAKAMARLTSAQADLAQAREDSLHSSNLQEKNLVSAASLARKKEAVRAAEARMQEAQAALDLESRRLSYTALRAEQDGVVAAVEAEAGQVLAAGQTVFRLASAGELEVVINVPENRLDALLSATQIQATLWAMPGVYHPAKIRETSPGVDAMIRTYTVKVSLPEADERVRLGMTATVVMRAVEPQPAAKLPLTALSRSEGGAAVWVVDAAGDAVSLRPVEVSRFDADSVSVVGGLAEEERVVTAGVQKLKPGEKVRVLEPE
jgi:multidrug efflux system membrane fusion protein